MADARRKHHRDAREVWHQWDGPVLNNQRAGSVIVVDHPWLQDEDQPVRVTGTMRPGRRRVVEKRQGGTVALPWETPVIEQGETDG